MTNRRGGMLVLAFTLLALVAIYALIRQEAEHAVANPMATADTTRAVKSVAQNEPGPEPTSVAPSVRSATMVQASDAAVPASPPPADVFRLVIADLKPGVEVPILKVKQGDPIALEITSSRSGTLEVHGYNQRVAIEPGAEATLAFKAEHAGRFPIHLHGADGKHLEVTAIEILPR